MYYNTTKSTSEQLNMFEVSASSQDHQILQFFKANPRQLASPSQLLALVFSNTVPVTSGRRSFTDLTAAAKLVKTDQQMVGPYRRPEYLWRLALEENNE